MTSNYQKPPLSGRSTASLSSTSRRMASGQRVSSSRSSRRSNTTNSRNGSASLNRRLNSSMKKRLTSAHSSTAGGTRGATDHPTQRNNSLKLPPLKPHLLTVKNVFGQQNTSQHSEKADIIIKALQEGCPDAFRETFRLAWREPVLVDEITGERFRIEEPDLQYLSELMRRAETMKRQGEWRQVYDIWREVGEFFLQRKDTDTALYYYGKAQTIAKQSSDMALEAKAYEDVGRVYATLGRLQESMKAHEAQLSLANAHREEAETKAARKKLVFIYIEMAKQSLKHHEKQQEEEQKALDTSTRLNLDSTNRGGVALSGTATLHNTLGSTATQRVDKYELTPAKSQAIKYLEKAYRTATQSQDPELEAQTACKLGETYESVHDLESAIKYQNIYLTLSEKQSNVPGMASAYKHLGKLYEMEEDMRSALKIYNRFLRYAEESGDIQILGEACEHMGLSLNAMGRYEKSVKYFERNFQLAQASENTEWINRARIHLGKSKGDLALRGFVNLIQSDDVNQLIRWKDSRDPQTLGNNQEGAAEESQVDDSESISSLDEEEERVRRQRGLDPLEMMKSGMDEPEQEYDLSQYMQPLPAEEEGETQSLGDDEEEQDSQDDELHSEENQSISAGEEELVEGSSQEGYESPSAPTSPSAQSAGDDDDEEGIASDEERQESPTPSSPDAASEDN